MGLKESTSAMFLLVAVGSHYRSIISAAALAYLPLGVLVDLGIRVMEFLGDGEGHSLNPSRMSSIISWDFFLPRCRQR